VITDVAGVRVGHWTGSGTGVTVVLLPPGTIGSGEVRGGAPATREIALLDPTRTVATAHGVVEHLAAQGRGVPTRGGPVPIVPAAAIFDLTESAGSAPGAAEGLAAARSAETLDAPLALGRIGAGRGARVGGWRGREFSAWGGVGSASASADDATVGALAVVNAVGDVVGSDGRVLAGSSAPPSAAAFPETPLLGEHTTLVCVATDARLTKIDCFLVAQSAHHGLARAIHPSHTRFDGDLVVAVATGVVQASVDRVRIATTEVVAGAVRSAVRAD
jgi:L-aminopeptidase/D-esterase-like protein